MEGEWSSDVDFVCEIQKRPCLYNMSCKEYRNLNARQKAWEEIATILNMTVTTCTSKWKTIRDRYVQLYRKSGSGADSVIEDPSWIVSKYLAFPQSFNQAEKHFRKLQGNAGVEGEHTALSPQPSESLEGNSEEPSTSKEQTLLLDISPYPEHADILEESTQQLSTAVENHAETVVPGKRRRLHQTALDRVVNAMNAPMAIPPELRSEKEDAYTMIFRGFSEVFKNEPHETKGRIVGRTWSIIQEEMAHGSNQ